MVIPGIRGMSLREFIKRLYRHVVDDGATDSAAQLSYYFLFALFPFLFFIVSLAAYLPIQSAVDALLIRLDDLMPDAAIGIINDQVHAITEQKRHNLLTFGALTTLWSASRGVDALRKAMNFAYHVPESRPWWRTQLVAIAMTVAGTGLILLAFAGFVFGGHVGHALESRLGIDHQVHELWSWLRWPVTAVAVMTAAALFYYFLPDVDQEFKFITPGSVLGTLAWLGATWGFSQYVDHFGHFNATYGSLGGVIVLLLWLYIGATIFIVGGEMNSIIEHASREGKAEGARTADGPVVASPDGRPLPLTPGAAKRRDASKRLQGSMWRRIFRTQ